MTDLDAIREVHRVGTLRGAMLLAHLDGRPGYVSRDDVLAIEKEAAAQALARVAELEAALEPERLARMFHDAYEALAPSFGYETRPDSARAWEYVPEVNRKLMVATATAVLTALARPESKP